MTLRDLIKCVATVYYSLRSEDVLKRYANNEVVDFDYDSEKDKLSLVV